jgi:hypothetical protein
MTKSKASSALSQLIDTNYVTIKAMEWVERGSHDIEIDGAV